MKKNPCERCWHSPDSHRLDDSLGYAPTDPDAPFRCVEQDCACPDFVGEAVSLGGGGNG